MTRLVGLAALAALIVAAVVASGRMTHGFSSYYTAAHALAAGQFGPWVYSDASFGAHLTAVVGWREALAGLILGAVFAIKPTIGPLLLMLLWSGRYRVVLWSAAAAALIVLFTIPVVGVEAWVAWPGAARAFVARPSTSVTAYQTTTGFLRHVCVADAVNQSPIGECGTATAVVPLLTTVAAIAITLWQVPRAARRLAIAAGICLSLQATPIAEDHQFVLLAIPIFILAADAPDLRAWLAAAVLLLWLPGSWTWERFTAGWWALLAYPRLLATWGLWALTIVAVHSLETSITDSAGR